MTIILLGTMGTMECNIWMTMELWNNNEITWNGCAFLWVNSGELLLIMVDSVTSSLNTGDAFGYSNIDYVPKLDQIRNLIVLDKRCASKPG